MFWLSVGYIIIVVVSAVFANYIAPYDPYAIDPNNILSPPSLHHLFGTDRLGRDLFCRVIYAGRISIEVSLIAVGISTLIGVAYGAVSGYFGGIVDTLMMRFVDVMLTFPVFFLILAIVVVLGPNILNVMVVIGLTGWMGIARIVRAESLKLRELGYIQAAKLLKKSDAYILIRHIIPNCLSPVVVYATLGVGSAILAESALSFLGLGVQPPTASWGSLLSEGKDVIEVAWWMSFFPGVVIFLTVISFTILGEKLKR
ncbi:ABC-type transporter, integral membrane subunit [Hippea maritima DSM 10411]|uniref:ABC-type transporter, integral membrane subunit n=1 Tax=Hippea maritima (strain ATCC 700847 / DSM 10411 / MH2) TaxID=760142 RepID=F2LTJ7_HIPMA|nr:ABC-type transporter, integral membrane subunit [Hippea maritima DSM 10411]